MALRNHPLVVDVGGFRFTSLAVFETGYTATRQGGRQLLGYSDHLFAIPGGQSVMFSQLRHIADQLREAVRGR